VPHKGPDNGRNQSFITTNDPKRRQQDSKSKPVATRQSEGVEVLDFIQDQRFCLSYFHECTIKQY
jgi:hypothetical protein